MSEMEFFLFPGSTYSYLSVMRISDLASRAGVSVRWRPFNVRAIMVEMDNRFLAGKLAGKPLKYRYMWRDIERRAARHGIPFTTHPAHPVDPEALALRVALVAAEEGWCEEFLRASYTAWFLEHRSPGTGEVTQQVVAALGRDAGAVLARAASPDITARMEAETEAARRLGIFGSPSFAVGTELFWGDDRLEEAIEWAQRPVLASAMPAP